jgi:hypothetical protein
MSLRPTPASWPAGSDADRADAFDRAALVQEVGADDPPVDLGQHPPDRRMLAPHPDHSLGGLQDGEVAREPVVVVDAGEGLEQDPRARVDVAGQHLPQHHASRGRGRNGFGHGLPLAARSGALPARQGYARRPASRKGTDRPASGPAHPVSAGAGQ